MLAEKIWQGAMGTDTFIPKSNPLKHIIETTQRKQQIAVHILYMTSFSIKKLQN